MGIVLVVISNDFSSQWKVFQGKSVILYLQHTFVLFPNMLICPSDIFSSTSVMLLGQVSALWNAVFYSAYQLSCWRSFDEIWGTIFGIDIMYMIYLDVKYFSVVCLSIYYEKPAIKTTLRTMEHCFAKKLNYCPSDIICNSVA